MSLINDLINYKKSHLNDSYYNLSGLTGIKQDRLMDIIDEIVTPTDDEIYHIERLIY